MLLNIILFVVFLGIFVISLTAKKDSVILEYLKNHLTCYYAYHTLLSFYASLLGTYGLSLREKSFEKFLHALGKKYVPAAEIYKAKLFAGLKDTKNEHLTILEIGIGTGANFRYYPKECDLIVVEPNPEFRKDVDDKLKLYKGIHLKEYLQISGENISLVEDESVDVVITTVVLCSVESIHQVTNEILRVLKPGGKYYFFEHVYDRPWTFRWILQYVSAVTNFWPFLFLGCSFRDIPLKIQHAGFAAVKNNYVTLDFGSISPISMIAPHCYGVATK